MSPSAPSKTAQLSAIATPKKVIRALYDYNPPTEHNSSSTELAFTKGDFFHVIGQENDSQWYEASNPATGARGLVPVDYFEVLGKTIRHASSASTSRESSPDPRRSFSSDYSHSAAAAAAAAGNATTLPSEKRVSPLYAKMAHSPLYGVVQYDFKAERPDELQARAGEPIIVIAQSNEEWLVAKPIGRLGGPGLIPLSYIEIRDIATNRPVDNVALAVEQAGVPKVEQWKKLAADYKSSSIPLGRFDFQEPDVPANGTTHTRRSSSSQSSFSGALPSASGLNMANLRLSNYSNSGQAPQHSSTSSLNLAASQKQTLPALPGSDAAPQLHEASSSSKHSTSSKSLLNVKRASVPAFYYSKGQYWFLLKAEMEDGRFRNLCRYYEDFYDFQISLLGCFPTEAGRTGAKRILPYMPGPLEYVNDQITNQRQIDLNIFVREICALPSYISHHSLVQKFFVAREGDIESPEPTSLIPQPKVQHASPARQTSNHQKPSAVSSKSNTLHEPQPEHISPRKGSADVLTSPYQNTSATSPYGANKSTTSVDTRSPTPASNNPANAPPYLKIKCFYEDNVVAIRVPPDVTYDELLAKLETRLGTTGLAAKYRDEDSGTLKRLANNYDLEVALAENSKLVLQV